VYTGVGAFNMGGLSRMNLERLCPRLTNSFSI
jgi:hypothetical protein